MTSLPPQDATIHSPGCYHHLFSIISPGRLYTSRKRSTIGLVAMYCATVF